MRKTDRDIRYEDEARKMNEDLPGRISIVGGGRKGPFAIVVNRLGRRQVKRIAEAVVAILEKRA